jgi:type IV secretory pathway VirB6-like protein
MARGSRSRRPYSQAATAPPKVNGVNLIFGWIFVVLVIAAVGGVVFELLPLLFEAAIGMAIGLSPVVILWAIAEYFD